MSEQLTDQLNEAKRKRRKKEFYLNVRDFSALMIGVSLVTLLLYVIATGG